MKNDDFMWIVSELWLNQHKFAHSDCCGVASVVHWFQLTLETCSIAFSPAHQFFSLILVDDTLMMAFLGLKKTQNFSSLGHLYVVSMEP